MITRSQNNKSVVSQIENILTKYFSENKIKEEGLPTVKYLAEIIQLSPSYLSDILKRETGKNTQEHIHFYLIEEAKNYLINTDKNINEIAYHLGFDYPQYFNKLFKQKTGKTPLEYRNLNWQESYFQPGFCKKAGLIENGCVQLTVSSFSALT